MPGPAGASTLADLTLFVLMKLEVSLGYHDSF